MWEEPQRPESEPDGHSRGTEAPPTFLFLQARHLERGNTRPRRCRCDFWSKSCAAGNRAGRWAILAPAAEFSPWPRNASAQDGCLRSITIELPFRLRKQTRG